MAEPVLRLSVSMKGGLTVSHPERNSEAVVEQLTDEGVFTSIREHSNGDLVKFTSTGQSGVLTATVLINGTVNINTLPRYERAMRRGVGGRVKSWSVTPDTV